MNLNTNFNTDLCKRIYYKYFNLRKKYHKAVRNQLLWSQHLTTTCIVRTQNVTAIRLENGRIVLKPVV